MSRNKPAGKKKRLVKRNKQTKWCPFWVVPKKAGTGKKIHPSRFSTVKRFWRRTKTKA